MKNLLASLLLSLLALPPARVLAAPEVRVVIDTAQQTLTVFRGETIAEQFPDIAIGRNGTTPDKRVHDKKTPLGEYRVARIKHDSDYHLFLGLDFPTEAQARRALERGLIDRGDYDAIAAAAAGGRLPPQNTPLGGYIGIHGVGNGDLEIHRSFNWTEGCIALTNEEVDRLAGFVRMGTPVEVR